MTKINTRFFKLFFFLSLLGPTNALAGTQDASIDPNMDIGVGFSTISSEAKGECVDVVKLSPVGGNAGQNVTFSLRQLENTNSLSELLDISNSASLKAISGTTKGKASFLRSVKMNDYSLYALASVKVENNTEKMRNVRFNDHAIRLIKDDDSKRFQEVCGDEFVIGKISGGEFHAIIEIQTKSVQDKKSIDAKLSGSYGIFSGSSQFEKSIDSIAKTNSVQVYVYSSGGSGEAIPSQRDEMVKAGNKISYCC